jgi:hypothetical protein
VKDFPVGKRTGDQSLPAASSRSNVFQTFATASQQPRTVHSFTKSSSQGTIKWSPQGLRANARGHYGSSSNRIYVIPCNQLRQTYRTRINVDHYHDSSSQMLYQISCFSRQQHRSVPLAPLGNTTPPGFNLTRRFIAVSLSSSFKIHAP